MSKGVRMIGICLSAMASSDPFCRWPKVTGSRPLQCAVCFVVPGDNGPQCVDKLLSVPAPLQTPAVGLVNLEPARRKSKVRARCLPVGECDRIGGPRPSNGRSTACDEEVHELPPHILETVSVCEPLLAGLNEEVGQADEEILHVGADEAVSRHDDTCGGDADLSEE